MYLGTLGQNKILLLLFHTLPLKYPKPGILLPSLNRARGMARGTGCMNNIRQIGLGVAMYQGDSKNYFPGFIWGGAKFYDELRPYLRYGTTLASQKVFVCSEDTKRINYPDQNPAFHRSYGINEYMSYESASQAKPYNSWARADWVTRPEIRVYKADIYNALCWPTGIAHYSYPFKDGSVETDQGLHFRHIGDVNVLFADMHFERRNVQSLRNKRAMVSPGYPNDL